MRLKHDEGWNVPADRPFYPPLPARYRNVRFQFVFFRADPAAVGRLLPEPLEPADDGACMASGLTVPFCSNYGPFDEAFVVLKCAFRGQPGWYCSHVLHNGPCGIAAGREIYGTPKIYAGLEVKQAGRAMTTVGKLADLPVMTVASTMESACAADDLPPLTPAWRLKIIPRADGPGPAIKQLIDCTPAMRDMRVHVILRGTGTVRFDPNPLCDLTGLAPREYLDAFYMEADYTETYAAIAYDYLAAE